MANEIRNGLSAALLAEATWRKSSRSGALGNCVEVAALDSDQVAVRNSRYPSGPALIYSRAEVAAFVAGVKDGEFDDGVS
ncbi:MAG: DUF397 domain-containing protein [Actinomycetota bacterium]|nr:DUF397 domain-containing protein [Actinomycetota bacterium]